MAANPAMVRGMDNQGRKNPLSGLWKTLLHPDREEAEMKERLVVISAANQLQVGEFQILQLAYREWYGKGLPEAMVTKLFTAYMLRNHVPHWARHYARRIVDGCESGELDDNAAKFHRYDYDYHTSVPQGVQKFWVVAASVVIAVFGSIYIADQVVDEPISMLPPYFEKKNLPQVLPDMQVQKEHFISPGGAGNFSDVKRSDR